MFISKPASNKAKIVALIAHVFNPPSSQIIVTLTSRLESGYFSVFKEFSIAEVMILLIVGDSGKVLVLILTFRVSISRNTACFGPMTLTITLVFPCSS